MYRYMNILIILLAIVLLSACAVRRPLFSPHREATKDHIEAKTIQQCLACHRDDMPHEADRGDCLRCHRLLRGEQP